MKILKRVMISVAALSITLFSGALSADSSDSWEFGATIYGWFPDISGTTSFPIGEDQDFDVPIGDILDNLQFTLQGSFDARKGNWGFFSDVIYLDLGKNKSQAVEGTIGDAGVPVDVTAAVNFDMKSLIWTNAAYYRLVNEEDRSFDLLFGLRYSDVEQTLKWSIEGDLGQLPLPGRDGKGQVSADYWDAVLGLRGHRALGDKKAWYLAYYADIGTGDSDFTWQAAAGFGYTFNWGQVTALWRHLDYDLPSDKPMGDMDFSGPQIGVRFTW